MGTTTPASGTGGSGRGASKGGAADPHIHLTTLGPKLEDASHYLLLAPKPGNEPATLLTNPDVDGDLGDERVMEFAEWVYFNVEEVWSGFNLLAEAVAKGFTATASTDADQDAVDAWNRRVGMDQKVRMWVQNALVYGRSVMEATGEFLKVRNPRSVKLEQDDKGELTKASQEVDGKEHPLPLERIHVFTLHRLWSDDVRGISAVRPVLRTIDDMLGAREVNRVLQRRYRAPIRLIELPKDATEQDRRALQKQLEETPPDMDIVLPAGATVRVIGHGDEGLKVDELMREHLTDRIFMGLGIPKIALGLPDGSNRSTSQTQRELLLAQKVRPYQLQVERFAEKLYRDVLGVDVSVGFDPVDARDEEALAEVSRVLVEAGIKTPEEVEKRWWGWGETGRFYKM